MGVYLTGVHLTGVYLTGVHLIGVYLMGGSGQRNAGVGEVKGLGKKIGGVLASTVSYFSTLQLSDTLSVASRSRKACPGGTICAF